MASLSPKAQPVQREASDTPYQLFAPVGDDFLYHGLNFAAYGGKVNRFDGYGNSHMETANAQLPYSRTFNTARDATAYLNYLRETGQDAGAMFEGNSLDDELSYINSLPVDERGVFTGPSITYHSAEPFSDRSYVDVLADYKNNQRLNKWNWTGDWDYYKDMAEWKRQHPYQNMMYDAMSTLPVWPVAIPLLEGAGAAYSMLPSAVQGGLNLLGAVEGYNDFVNNTAPALKDAWNRSDWKDGLFNTGRGLFDATGVVGGAAALTNATKRITNTIRNGNSFASRLALDLLNPEVSVWKASKAGSYPWLPRIRSNRIEELTPIAENAKGFVLDRIQESIMQSPYLKPGIDMEEI